MSLISDIDIYINSSNRESLCVLECDLPVDLRGVSKISIETLDGETVDSEMYPQCFEWGYPAERKCVISLYLGRADLGLGNGVHNADLYLYDEFHSQGSWYGMVRLFVYFWKLRCCYAGQSLVNEQLLG